jgi:two-component system, response regulator PdtaR
MIDARSYRRRRAIVAMHLAMLVVELGHEVCAIVASAADAVTRAVTLRPDVVLMGIRLAGGSSGGGATRELYARQALRCIFLSANLDEPTRTELLPYDPIDFIGKAVLPILLQRALRKAEGLTEP